MNNACLIVYASMSGNTEYIANLIGEGFKQSGTNVVIKDILEIDVKELQNYDGILLGAYTWGNGELPDEFLDFYEDLDCINLQGKFAAAFGSCDSAYEHFGGAVDILLEKLKILGADVVLEGLKIEQAPTGTNKEKCIRFGKLFVETILERG